MVVISFPEHSRKFLACEEHGLTAFKILNACCEIIIAAIIYESALCIITGCYTCDSYMKTISTSNTQNESDNACTDVCDGFWCPVFDTALISCCS